MAMTLTNYRIGAAYVAWGTAGAEVDLGATKGGVEFSIEQQMAGVNADQFSDALIDEVVIGKSAKIKIPLYEANIDSLAYIFEGWTTDGSTNKRTDFELNVGRGNLTNSAQLLIKRMTNETTASTNEHEWWRFPYAIPVGPYSERMDWTNQVIYEVTFHVYPGPLYLDSGTGTGALNTLTDSSKTWVTNAWQNKYVTDSAGTDFAIVSNNATALTVSGTPASGAYTISNYAEPQYGLGYRGYADIDAW